MNDSQTRPSVGLLCGSGGLPRAVARTLRRRGKRIVAVCIRGDAEPEMEALADEVHWTGVAKLGYWVKTFKAADVEAMLMVGGINKRRMFDNKAAMLPDWRTVMMWYRRLRTREDHTILGAVADEFESEGIRVASVPEYCPELLVRPGCLTRREPTRRQWRDIRFGWGLVKKIAALQIGQCIVVKDRAVIAVEGIDGTDATLRRGGELAGGKAVAVKVAKEGHDSRFDIPCIGPTTVETLRESGVSVLAVEPGRTIALDAGELREEADRNGVVVVAPDFDEPPEATPQ